VRPNSGGDLLFDGLLEAARAAEREGESVEAYERRGAALEVSEDDDGVRISESRERGFAVRVYRSGRTAFAAAGPDSGAGLLDRARVALPRSRARRGARAAPPVPGDAPAREDATELAPPDESLASELLGGFRRFVAAAGEGAVALSEASIALGERRERIATTAGREAAWTTRAASLVGTVVGKGAGRRFSARVVAAAARPEELPLHRLARHAADRVLLPLHGRPLEASRFDLLLDSHVAAHVVARLAPLFLGDDADALLAARTRNGRDPLAAPLLSLVDDASAPGGPVRTVRDGEGTPQARHVVVERGVPVSRLTDVAAAARRGTPPTGNAVRRAWSDPPSIGVTNFFVDPAAGVSPLDLLGRAAKGFYAAILLSRPAVDVTANRFRLHAGGYLIEKGRAAGRVSEAVISGRLSDLLRRVEAVGDDLKFVAGAGGGAGSPTLYVPRWKND